MDDSFWYRQSNYFSIVNYEAGNAKMQLLSRHVVTGRQKISYFWSYVSCYWSAPHQHAGCYSHWAIRSWVFRRNIATPHEAVKSMRKYQNTYIDLPMLCKLFLKLIYLPLPIWEPRRYFSANANMIESILISDFGRSPPQGLQRHFPRDFEHWYHENIGTSHFKDDDEILEDIAILYITTHIADCRTA